MTFLRIAQALSPTPPLWMQIPKNRLTLLAALLSATVMATMEPMKEKLLVSCDSIDAENFNLSKTQEFQWQIFSESCPFSQVFPRVYFFAE